MRRCLVAVGVLLGVLMPAAPALAQPAPPCRYILGFQALHDLDPSDVGDCLDNQAFAANGDALQHTTNGLLAWLKLDNWMAFTDGYWTWVNGPYGLLKRLNTQRYGWETNPERLLSADPGPPAGDGGGACRRRRHHQRAGRGQHGRARLGRQRLPARGVPGGPQLLRHGPGLAVAQSRVSGALPDPGGRRGCAARLPSAPAMLRRAGRADNAPSCGQAHGDVVATGSVQDEPGGVLGDVEVQGEREGRARGSPEEGQPTTRRLAERHVLRRGIRQRRHDMPQGEQPGDIRLGGDRIDEAEALLDERGSIRVW